MNDQPITKEQAAAFEREYLEVCAKHGLVLSVNPQWKQSADTGTWSMVLVMTIIKYNPPQAA